MSSGGMFGHREHFRTFKRLILLPIGQLHLRLQILQSHARKTESRFPRLLKAKWHHFLLCTNNFTLPASGGETQPPTHPELIQPSLHTHKKTEKNNQSNKTITKKNKKKLFFKKIKNIQDYQLFFSYIKRQQAKKLGILR